MSDSKLASNNAQDRKEALDGLIDAPDQAVERLDEILGLLDDPLAGCDDLGELGAGQAGPIGRMIATRSLGASLGKAMAAAAGHDESALDRICRTGAELKDTQIRLLEGLGADLLLGWCVPRLAGEDPKERDVASRLLQAMTTDYKGRLASAKGILAGVVKGPPKRPVMLAALSEGDAGPLLRALEAASEWIVRTRIVTALGCLAPSPELVSALVAALDDPHERVQECAIRALELFGPAAKEALPALKARMKGGDPAAKERCKAAMARIKG